MKKDVRITVFTPTYNRGNDKCLGKCYVDLKKQTCKDFIWLIIDDGSTDETQEYVKPWLEKESIKANGFEIQYIYKRNGGTHTGYNKAFDLCTTELIFCLETDDEILPDGIKTIVEECTGEAYDQSIGLIFPTYYIGKNEPVGTFATAGRKLISFHECYYKFHNTGDKFFVYKTKSIDGYRFPEFKGEKLCSTAAMLLLVHGRYKIVNKDIYHKSYLDDGYSKVGIRNYINSPHGFAYFHRVKLAEVSDLITILKSAIHYTACSLLIKDKKFIVNSPRKMITVLTLPAGVMWYYLLKKQKKAD